MKALCIVTKATSTLDYLIPIIDFAKEKGEKIDWKIVYWDKQTNIIKNQTYYEKFLHELPSVDWSDLSGKYLNSYQKILWKNRFYRYFNKEHSSEIYELMEKLIKFESPDLIIYDHREVKKYGIESMKNAVEASGLPVILIPHAPHHTSISSFVPFSKKSKFPKTFYYWKPFLLDICEQAVELEDRSRFEFMGYPGLDSKFLNSISHNSNSFVEVKIDKKVKVIFFLRKIFNKTITEIPKGHDELAFFYYEFSQILMDTYQSLEKSFPDFELYLKPHPATSVADLKDQIIELKLKNVFVDNNSVYSQMGKYDIFLSFYSTTIWVPVACKKLSFIINSRVQGVISRCEAMKALYEGSPVFVNDIKELPGLLENLNQNNGQSALVEESYKHLRKYFAENSVQLVLKRILEIGYSAKK